MFQRVLPSLLIFFASFGSAFAAEFPADWKFKTLRSPHFDIIVNAEQQELGRFYAGKLERAYSLLKPLFTDVPERVTVVIADKTDLTNGYASPLPYRHMFFFPVLPGPQETIGETGDWALELAIHELTHILTFEAVSGVMEPLQNVFGTILSPNILLPLWWKEGVAVQTETQLSHGGRLRAVFQDGVLRSLADEGGFSRYDIATINERIPFWTDGMTAYLFGSVFWSEAVAEKGPEVMDRLHQHHGGRVPYLLDGPATEHLGTPYETFYRQALFETESRLRRQLETLRQVPLTEPVPLKVQAKTLLGPRLSPDGESLAVIAVDETNRRTIRVFRRHPETGDFLEGIEDSRFVNRREDEIQPATPDAPPSGSISRLSWIPDSHKLVFDKVDWVSRFEAYSDLWIFDTETGKSKALTRGLRGREPFVSRDGKFIYYIALANGQTALARFDLKTESSEILWRGQAQDRLSFPTELDDGSVVFAVRGEDGWEGLRRLRPGEKDPEVILDDYRGARFPEGTPAGLMFTSSQNGVHNLYLADPNLLKAKPLTHVKGSVFASIQDPKTGDLYVGYVTSQGLRVGALKVNPEKPLPETLPRVEALFADRYPNADRVEATPEVPVEVDEYRPGSYLLPRYWIPFVSVSAVNNSLVFEASTSGFDPLKKHLYSLSAGWDSGVNEASYSALYQNNQLPWALTFQGTKLVSYLVSTENPLSNELYSVGVSPDVFPLSRYLSTQVSWQFRRTSFGTSEAERMGPSLLALYSNFGRSGTQISPEEGGYLLGGVTHFVPGEDRLSYSQSLASGALFWSRWLPKRHAVALKFNSFTTPESLPSIFGVSTTNFFLSQDAPQALPVVRGYEVGQFVGKSLHNLNLEYRFPLEDLYRGFGMTPLYLLRVHGAVYADAVALDGFAYRAPDQRFEAVNTDRIFGSVGAEARLETTVGYLLPLNLVVGYSLPLSPSHAAGPGLNLALQLGALF